MAEKNYPAAACARDIREAVCIHTNKIFDSCKDKDCIEDLRVYLTNSSQAIISAMCSIRPRTAKLLFADVKVDEINFNRGCYTVDVTYFYKITGEAFPGETPIMGLAIFEKRVILYGSESCAKVFSSRSEGFCTQTRSLPTAVVEAVDPLPLSMKIVDADCYCDQECGCREIPQFIIDCFGEALVTDMSDKQLYVTLGQFSIIRLERDTQLLIPAYDYCVPEKDCSGMGAEDDPCALFTTVPFPVADFFPPNGSRDKCHTPGACGC
jgi:hypothetical protein